MNLLVVGAGEMGRWFARTLQGQFTEELAVAFADTNAEASERAADTVSGRSVPTDTEEHFDVVCVAVPIPAAATVIGEYADRADRALVDVTGVMSEPLGAMREVAPRLERVSFHPLFAASNAPGSLAVVADSPGPVTDRIRDALTAAGNDCFETTPEEHDRAMETVQARTHAAILAFGLAAEDVPEEFQTPISEGLLDLLAEMTANDPGVYADIQTAFEGADDVADAARHIADADRAVFETLYRDADPRTDGPDWSDDDGTEDGGTDDSGAKEE